MTEPTDAELVAFAVEEEFLLFCSDEEFLQIARAVLAKWGSPVVAGEPYAYAVYFPDQPCEELVHDLDDLTEALTNREHAITKLYATPQPTQAQAGAVPLTDEQIKDEASHHGFMGSTELLVKFVRGIEAAHGIKGGQHDI